MSDSVIENARATAESAFRECSTHVERMEDAASVLSAHFPLSAERLTALDGEAVARLDQFVYRFMKLQDSMAARLLPSLETIVRADNSPRPFLDMIADLEKFGVLPAETDWQYFRNLRNNLAHDYPESVDQTAATLNALHDRWPRFAAILTSARRFYDGLSF